MLKKILALFFMLAVLSLPPGCSKGVKYYNRYYGIMLEVPEKFSLDAFAPENLSTTKSDTLNPEGFITEWDDYGYFNYYNFALLSATGDIEDEGFAQLYLSGDKKSSFSTMDLYITYIKQRENDNESVEVETIDEGLVTHNGKEFRKLTFIAVSNDGSGMSFRDEYYICEAGDIFLSIYLFSWEGYDKSLSNSKELLKCVTIE